ncbi:DUF6521 family protein [Priestia aryabhattai]|uniref:three component ABC system middle component n=1 Tax=Priestia aryabhattai TaxID=412384 RepID=UPI001CD53AAB|nr:three component ABC system middle component [Priestia aryabhattai]MCA1050987.1 DUF6521 family protein [Priestia aryabhattai]
MGVLSKEIQIIQNPALGAMILKCFTEGYISSEKEDSLPFPLLFIVLPMVFHNDTLSYLNSTRRPSGLRALVNKMSDSKESKRDIVLDIHERADKMKKLTLDALRIALATELLELDSKQAKVKVSHKRIDKSAIIKSNSKMFKSSEKLGFWCSQLNMQEISMILKVGF